MPSFRPSARHLYLLALFQLVGGPLVILSVVFFSRLTVKYSADHGVTTGVTKAWQSPEWQAVTQALSGAPVDHSKSSSPDSVPLTQEPIGKLVGVAWVDLPLLLQQRVPEEIPSGEIKRFASAWPQAPPIPPPRCV